VSGRADGALAAVVDRFGAVGGVVHGGRHHPVTPGHESVRQLAVDARCWPVRSIDRSIDEAT
jgi:hypothetical protein